MKDALVTKFKLILKHIIRKSGFEICALGKMNLLESLIYKNNHPDFYFIQIGANDGRRFDPIHNSVRLLDLRGIVIEPVKEYFQELSKNYEGTRVTAINKAIYEEDKQIAIYRAKHDINNPEWSKGIASLDPLHHKKSNFPHESIEAEMVEAITYSTLFKNYNVNRIDLLVIDTEGYDYNLVKIFPFEKFKPSIIQFEHGIPNSIMSLDQIKDLTGMLISYGYKLFIHDYDIIAYI